MPRTKVRSPWPASAPGWRSASFDRGRCGSLDRRSREETACSMRGRCGRNPKGRTAPTAIGCRRVSPSTGRAASPSQSRRRCEQFVGIAVVVGHGVRVLDVEIVATRLHSSAVTFRACGVSSRSCASPAPPVDAALQMLKADRLRHRIGSLAFGHAMLVEPDVFGR
jgi:hypothetical protein